MDIELPELDLDKLVVDHQDLLQQMQQQAISADYMKLGELNSKAKSLEHLISTWKNLQVKMGQYSQNLELLNDPEMQAIATEENSLLEAQIRSLITQVEAATLPTLPNDQSNAIFEIRSGTGGTEASLCAAEISRMYVRYASSIGFETEQISTSYHEEGGYKENVFVIKGIGAFAKFRFESGVHRVQRVPSTESSGRIHTSAISVVVMPEIEAKEMHINEQDLKIETFRSSGPGGQSVNTTDSAVRITHIPTGINVSSQDGKSQHKNKDKAMSILAAKLFALKQEEELKEINDLRAQSIQGGDRSAKIRTYNFPQGRVTDHRVKLSWFNLAQITEGELDAVVSEVNTALRKQYAQLIA
jgi:peptide chain release factor 1